MKKVSRIVHLAMIVLVVFPGKCVYADAQPANLIPNGGFEKGANGWNWGQARGLPEPGFVDREAPYKGGASYTMGLTGVKGERLLYVNTTIDPTKDYELSVVLRGKGLAKGSVFVNLLQWSTAKNEKPEVQGWVCLAGQPGVWQLITAGGTFAWRQFKVHIYKQTIKPTTKRLTLYIRHSSIGQGELGIDDVSLIPVEPIKYKKPVRAENKRPPPIESKKSGPSTTEERRETGAFPDIRKKKLGTELLVAPGDSAKGWGLNLGREFPGAKGGLTTERVGDRKVLKVAFDFSGGGRYVGAQRSVAINEADALVFGLRSAGWSYFTVCVWDATGQAHHGGFHSPPGDWKRIALPLTELGSHWGGAHDGKIHFPLKRILVSAATARKGGEGHFLLRDLGVRVAEPKKTWQIDVTTNQPGHIHFAEEARIDVSATVRNRLRVEREASVTIEVINLERKKVASSTAAFRFDPWAALSVHLGIDSPGPGYFYVSVSVGNGTAQEKGEGAFGVVPRPLRYGQRDSGSFFGMTVSNPVSAARIGVHWERCFHFWKYSEYHPGEYSHVTDHITDCLAAGLDVMMLLDYREPAWLEPKTGKDGLPTEAALERYAAFARDAVRAHPGVAVFEIQNEPNGELGYARNLPLDRAVEFYARIVRKIAPIIRKEAPHALICGCTVSGTDYSSFPFSRAALRKVGQYLDIYGPHPYASPRIFGPGLRPAFPEDNMEAEKHRAALRLLHEVGGPRKMWIGEKGWAIKDKASLPNDVSRSFADCTARSLIIAKSVPGVEKYIWHMQVSGNAEGGRYALFRGAPLQPMPGAIAYANVAYRLDHAQPIESFKMAGGTIQAHVFNRPLTKTAVATIWSVHKPFAMKAKLPKGARAFDLYGRQRPTESIALTGAPVFIQAAGAEVDDLLTGIKEADLTPDSPFEAVLACLADVNTLRLGLVNQTGKTLPVQSRVNDEENRIILPAVTGPTWIDISLRAPVTQRAGKPLQVTLSADRSKPYSIPVVTDVLPVTRRITLTVDGDARDWNGVPVIVLDTRDRILPPDPAGWDGPRDLSARISLAWDARNLYLLVRVADDKHVTPNLQAFWVSDSLQIAVDPMNDAREIAGFDDDDREYGVLVDANGTHRYQTHPRDANPTFQASARRTGTETLYEMAFPWAGFERRPEAGMVFSLNVIVNENDGAGRKYWMGITPGIGEGKRPSVYRDFYLKE